MSPVRGFAAPIPRPPEDAGDLTASEALAVRAVGRVIEFWGFKESQGRVWALLYLRGQALSAAEIQAELGLSKGGVSMITRELERWGVIRRLRAGRSRAWRFEAGQDLMAMVRRVIEARERPLLQEVVGDLGAALASDERSVDHERLSRVLEVAELFSGALELFLQTASLDLQGAASALKDPPARQD